MGSIGTGRQDVPLLLLGLLLVLLERLVRPLRRLVLAVILVLVCLSLVLVNRGRVVLGGGVDGVEDERGLAGVEELVLSSGGNDNEVSSLDSLLLAGDDGLAYGGGEGGRKRERRVSAWAGRGGGRACPTTRRMRLIKHVPTPEVKVSAWSTV